MDGRKHQSLISGAYIANSSLQAIVNILRETTGLGPRKPLTGEDNGV